MENVAFAGDVKVNDVTVISSKGFAIAITAQVVGIEIYEDIFSPFITGKIYIRDSQNLTSLLPLIGEEILKININTPTLADQDGYVGEYFITKIDDKVKLSEREIVYVAHFVSKEAIVDVNKQMSKAFKGKISDIAKTLFEGEYGLESKKQLNIEDTQNSTMFVSNFWSPIKCLQYICERAVNMNNSPSYIFFENKHGLNFLSLESMYTGSPIKQRFVWDNYKRQIESSGSVSQDIEKDYQRIIELDTPDTFDYFERITSGFYGSEIITYDILTKQYVHTGFHPKFSDSKHLNEFPLSTDQAPARAKGLMLFRSRYYNNFDNYDDVTNSKIVQKRKMMLAQAEGYKLNITVLGRTDYSAGQRVYLELPLNTQIKASDSEWQDKLISGNYLIAALVHFITVEGHKCTMQLIKDSFIFDVKAGEK